MLWQPKHRSRKSIVESDFPQESLKTENLTGSLCSVTQFVHSISNPQHTLTGLSLWEILNRPLVISGNFKSEECTRNKLWWIFHITKGSFSEHKLLSKWGLPAISAIILNPAYQFNAYCILIPHNILCSFICPLWVEVSRHIDIILYVALNTNILVSKHCSSETDNEFVIESYVIMKYYAHFNVHSDLWSIGEPSWDWQEL